MEILGLIDVPLWGILLACTLLLFYLYSTWTHTTWSSQGVPGPRPIPLFGNTFELAKMTQFRAYTHWQQKHGNVYGVYYGVRPVLVVTEIPLVKEVLVKNFTNFVDRNLIKKMRPPLIDSGLFFTGGTTWKRIRNLMTPSFSGAKLKLMSHFIKRCSDQLRDSLTQKATAGAAIDAKDVYGSFTMDVIAGTAFGLETNSQSEENEPFVTHCKGLFLNAATRPSTMRLFHVSNAFPAMSTIIFKITSAGVFFGGEDAKFFTGAVSHMIDQRREQNEVQKRTDLLQMLIDAEAEPSDITDVRVDNDDTKSHKRMTKEEIIGQGFLVFIAGYETTSTTLQYLTFNLVHNPDSQEKLYQEIIDNIGDESPTYENVSGLKYMEACFRETLRIFPPVPAIDRQALNPITLDGINLPAGCGVLIPIYTIMHDPRLFPEPEKFKPERYLKENRGEMDHILLELPFGYGPRQCIGMRLALLELKFAAIEIFRKFKFVKCDQTPEKITLGKSFGLSMPDVPIIVKAELR